MAIAQIKITYKQIVDAQAQTEFEKSIFHASYNEFLIKSKAFNRDGKLRTFSEMEQNDSRAGTIHYTLSFAVMHLFESLKSIIPNLTDNLGRSIAFDVPEFRLIESDLLDWAKHQIELSYTTGHLILHKIIGEYLLLSVPATNPDSRTEEANTFMLQLQPNLALTSYQEFQTKMTSDFTGFAAN